MKSIVLHIVLSKVCENYNGFLRRNIFEKYLSKIFADKYFSAARFGKYGKRLTEYFLGRRQKAIYRLILRQMSLHQKIIFRFVTLPLR